MKPLPKFAASLCLLASPVFAQDNPAAIVVLDGSGSMWGQIDGVAKITIAQEVMGELMTTLPADLELGLTVYGHRRKGDCSDIETLVLPGSDTRGAITTAVNGIKPKGKTPMADAVVAAARALRHTEEAATVILVSDGIETCVPDVCAVARELEETGVDFTAHVVGFDVDDPETLAQFQCMADTTGGQFLSAANADQLAAAVTEVAVAAPDPAPLPGSLIYSVHERLGDTNRAVEVEWSLLDANGEERIESIHAGFGEVTLEPGTYVIKVTRVSDGASQTRDVLVEDSTRTAVEFEFDAPLPQATLSAPAQVEAGSTFAVTWTGPDAEGDYIDTSAQDEDRYTQYETYSYTRDGTPLDLRAPAQPGAYQLRYVLADGKQIIATQPLTVTPRAFDLAAPDAAPAGSTIQIEWSGSGYAEDYVTVAATDQKADRYINYTYVRDGNPVDLQLPAEPGMYELRYVIGQDRSIGAARMIEVTEVGFDLSAADSAPAGSALDVTWTGSGNQEDYVTVAEAGTDGGSYINYRYVRDGNPVALTLPTAPGQYELRYINGQDASIATTRVIEVTAVDFNLTAAASAPIGSTLPVTWQGAGISGDYLTIAEAGSDGGSYLTYVYTRDGNPAPLRLPSPAGDYELRYINGQDATIAYSQPITLTDITVTLTAPPSVPKASEIAVTQDGPNYQGDYITIAEVGSDDGAYLSYSYTTGSDLTILTPDTPGAYELRYVVDANPLRVLGRIPVTVE